MVLCPWDSTGKNSAVDSRSLFQWIFPTQEIESASLASPALAVEFFTTEPLQGFIGETKSEKDLFIFFFNFIFKPETLY